MRARSSRRHKLRNERLAVVMPAPAACCREAGELSERYRLRGFDSIHLASFAEMLRGLQGREDVRFSCYDDHLNAAARRLSRTIR